MVGWGAFAYASRSGEAARFALQEYAAQAEADRATLIRAHEAREADLQGNVALLEHEVRVARSEMPSADVTQTGSLKKRLPTAAKPVGNPAVGSGSRDKTIADFVRE
jgi:hypothetical protein